ncbi:MAG: hypothetical protein HS111_01480 [Kofleriaceae bacterium]|nr:hypothetical protein [Kofleriaceae bacterium]MCL4226920.1 hypothetical protein [Myxococcales bacterium]
MRTRCTTSPSLPELGLPVAALLAAALAVGAGGCGDDHDDEDPDVEACEHLENGPFAAVTATADTTGAPAIAADHRAYTVTLPAGSGGNTGFVSFAAGEAGDYLFFLDQPATAAFSTAAGPLTPVQSTTSSPACATIAGRHLIELAVGTTFLQLTSATGTTVNVAVEAATDHAH